MQNHADQDPTEPVMREVRYEYTPHFPEILEHLKASILVTTYQAGKLLVLGVAGGKLQISFQNYEQPMGLAVNGRRIAIGTRKQMHFLVPAHETLRLTELGAAPLRQGSDTSQEIYDGCFVPRSSIYTGNIHGHDLAWGRDGLWIVNTLFSSLATLHEDYSFVPQWRPPFISQLIDQDRCHLNGLAMSDGMPAFVSAMSETDTPAGWRPTKANSGVVMQVPSGQVICRGLSMPHSPRLYGGRLWVLNSGFGSFGWIDPTTTKYEPVEVMPGYTRGLSFAGQFAFVGLSKIRETSVFGGVPIAEHRDQLRCGVGIVDLTTGKTVAVFQFLSGVSEIFAVEVLEGFANPLIAGASVDQQEREVWIVPADNLPRPKVAARMPIFSLQSANSVGHASGQSLESTVERALELRAHGQLDEAAQTLERAVALSSEPAALLVDLGNLRQDQGLQHAASICYYRALEADPTCIAALQNLGYLLFNMGEAEKSQDVYARLLYLQSAPLNVLLAASVLPVIYDSHADIDYWRAHQLQLLETLVASGQKADATKTLVPTSFFAAYQGLCDRRIMELRGQAIAGHDFTHGRAMRRSGRLKVGFLSAYFREHTIGRLNIGRLEGLNRENIELTIVQVGQANDPLAQRFATTADRFINLPRDLQAAMERLAGLELDLLVHTDVGMDALTQTLAFSRFAPIQIATWGHPDTTGSQTMDYFLSSEGLETLDGQQHYTERLFKLPSLGICYEQPQVGRILSRSELGLSETANLYGCPQTLFKLHPEFDNILARILEMDPQGQLVLLEGRLPEWTHRLQRRLRRSLPNADLRVKFLPNLPREKFLSLLHQIDVLLDPIHFGGGNSSLEALAMGTPIVTMQGDFLRSRLTSALLADIGLDELIVDNQESYSQLAVRIAGDVTYRQSLVQRIVNSAGRLFGRRDASDHLEAALLAIARNHR